jgi:hypothetical protein
MQQTMVILYRVQRRLVGEGRGEIATYARVSPELLEGGGNGDMERFEGWRTTAAMGCSAENYTGYRWRTVDGGIVQQLGGRDSRRESGDGSIGGRRGRVR